jgi:hypothetical protein
MTNSTQELSDPELQERYAAAMAALQALTGSAHEPLGWSAAESRSGAVDEYYELRQEMARRGLLGRETDEPDAGGIAPGRPTEGPAGADQAPESA